MKGLHVFQKTVWEYYGRHGRDLPWRQPELDGTFDPYKILVSEIMLQQTQASRVIPKYHEFIKRFPSAEALAAAPLGEVLRVWSGLGYNRRAKYLHDAAQHLAQIAQGPTLRKLPHTTDTAQGWTLCRWEVKELMKCKGVGKNTAAAVCVYAYNEPHVFIETNIRTVFIHHFFHDRNDVSDKEILPLVEAMLDSRNPREWYWALMDYGSYLKKEFGNLSQRSRHYVRQSPLQGSRRQIRGQVLRLLIDGAKTKKELEQHIADQRLSQVLQTLVDEALIKRNDHTFSLH